MTTANTDPREELAIRFLLAEDDIEQARQKQAMSPAMRGVLTDLAALDELAGNIEGVVETFNMHVRTAAGIPTDIKSQIDAVAKARNGLAAAKKLKEQVASIIELFPEDKTAARAAKDADVMVRRFEKAAANAAKMIRGLSKKAWPAALKALVPKITRKIKAKLEDPKTLQVLPWTVEDTVYGHYGRDTKGAAFQAVFRIDKGNGKKAETIVQESTIRREPPYLAQMGMRSAATPANAAAHFLKPLLGWPGLKGEGAATDDRMAVARHVLSVVHGWAWRQGDLYGRDGQIEDSGLTVSHSFRSGGVRWEDEDLGRRETDQHDVEARYTAALKKRLGGLMGGIKQVEVSYGDGGWYSIWVQIKTKARLTKRAKSNAKVVEVPNTFHKVVVEPPKAKRKEFPFEGYIDFQGLKIDVENVKGSTRSGTGPEGDWSTYMHAHYGEIRGTEGTDGDKLDVYVGDNHDSSIVVVIHQHNPATGKYDEDKVMIGFDSIEEAIGAYKKQYDRPGFYVEDEYTEMPIGQFWRWVKDGKKKGKKVTGGRRGPPSETGSAAMLKRQGLTPVDVFFGQAREHRRPMVYLGDGIQDRKGNIWYFVGVTGEGKAILAEDEREMNRLHRQLIEDRKHVVTAATQQIASTWWRRLAGRGDDPLSPREQKDIGKANVYLMDVAALAAWRESAGRVARVLRITMGEVRKRFKQDGWSLDYRNKAYQRRDARFYAVSFTHWRHTGGAGEYVEVTWYTGVPGRRWESKNFEGKSALRDAVALGNKMKPEADRISAEELGESPEGKLASKTAGRTYLLDLRRARIAKADWIDKAKAGAQVILKPMRNVSGDWRWTVYEKAADGVWNPKWLFTRKPYPEPPEYDLLDHVRWFKPNARALPKNGTAPGSSPYDGSTFYEDLKYDRVFQFQKSLFKPMGKTAARINWNDIKGYAEGKPGAINAAKVVLSNLLAMLRAVQWNHLTSHWQIGGDSSYGDHLLFERMYDQVVKETDIFAEKLVGSYGIAAVDAREQAKLMAFTLHQWDIGCPFERGLLVENTLMVNIKDALDAMEDIGQLSLGMDDFLRTMANDHETHLYLLQQRQGGVKMASALGRGKMAERRKQRAFMARCLIRLAAQVGTDTASIYAIAPEQLQRLIGGGKWAERWADGKFEDADTLLRQHGGAVWHTGADGSFDVEVEGSAQPGKGFLAPYGTAGFAEAIEKLASEVIKTAGWWSIGDGDSGGGIHAPPDYEGGLMNAIPGHHEDEELYGGDGPADVMDAALADIDLLYRQSWGRGIKPKEIDGVFDFCANPRKDGTIQMNGWVPFAAERMGMSEADLVSADWEALMAMKQADIDLRNSPSNRPRGYDNPDSYFTPQSLTAFDKKVRDALLNSKRGNIDFKAALEV